jgi:hypothetical protein
LSEKSLPQVLPYHPTTFLERGVVVPFTTPLLAGTRARPGAKQGLELVIPNPTGGRGVYIMAWTSIASVCSPTLHDRLLNDRIATLSSVTPSLIRRIGRELAVEGLAGEAAIDGARKSAEHDKGDRLVANYLLLMALVGQVYVPNVGQPSDGAPADPVEMQRRAQVAVHVVATRLDRSNNWVAAALEAVADAMATIGINAGNKTARVPRLVDLLQQCSTGVAIWSGLQQSDDQASYAEMICSVADFTLKLAENTLVTARALTDDVVALLRKWAVDPDPVIRLAARPEWLLDGWEQICLLWNLAEDDAARRAALVEMVQLLPVLPREAREWSDLVLEVEVSMRMRRLIPHNVDWRTGATVFDRIARNEHMRALAC